MALETKDIVQLKKWDLFMDGYFLEGATVFTPGYNNEEQNIPVFGSDNSIKGNRVPNSTLTIAKLEKYDYINIMKDLIHGYKPEQSDVRIYDPRDVINVSVWANLKNEANSQYKRCLWAENFAPPSNFATGEPDDNALLELTGNCDVIIEYANCGIFCDVLPTTGDADDPDTTYVMLQVPGATSGVYALKVVSFDDATDTFVDLSPVKTSYFIDSNTLDASTINTDAGQTSTDIMVVYLVASATLPVYPNATPDGKYSELT